MSVTNPWLERLVPLDESYIRDSSSYIPDSLNNLDKLPVVTACEALRGSFDQLFIPTEQTVKCLMEIIGMTHAHSTSIYTDKKTFLSKVYLENSPLPDFISPTCLTGVSGVGKSKIISALKRILMPPGEVVVNDMHPPFKLVSGWYLDVSKVTTLSQMLKCLLNDQVGDENNSFKVGRGGGNDGLINSCRTKAFKTGVPLMIVDELQFLTRSDSANSLVSNIIMRLSTIGVPLVYVANYSLCHRLRRRPQEDIQRLLSKPYILMPDPPDSEDWIETLKGYRDVAPDVFQFDPIIDARDIHGWTAGIKRLLKMLFVIAYREARSHGTSVGMAELRWAYMSPEYSMNRKDVDLVIQQYITEKCARKDLWCPFELPKSEHTALQEAAKAKRMQSMGLCMVKECMTQGERDTYKYLEEASFKKSKNAEIIKLPSKNKLINKDLREGEKLLKDLLLGKKDTFT